MNLYCMRSILLLFTFINLFACANNSRQVHFYKTGNFILADTVATAPFPWQTCTIPRFYPMYYFGRLKDTISISRRYCHQRTPIPQWPLHFAASRMFAGAHLRIEADTTIITDNTEEYFTEDRSFDDDAAQHYRSAIVTIRNISDSTVWIGRTFEVEFMHLECKNRQGQWIAVQKNLADYGICGTNQPAWYLKPGEIIITKTSHLQGAFTTECRLVLGYEDHLTYSNTFRESIDEKLLHGIRE